MADHLQKVGRTWRLVSIVFCLLTGLVCLALSILLWNDMIRRGSLYYEGKPLWVGVTIVTLLAVASVFVAWRLFIGSISANGRTILPTWFIQLFGVAFLAGMAILAWHGHHPLLFVDGVFIALAMILVGRNAAKSRLAQFNRRLSSLSEDEREKVLSQMSPENRQKLEHLLKKRATS